MQNRVDKRQRDTYIDFLRVLGLLLIIANHSHLPVEIARFRQFSVPLMVFVSALCVNFRGGI
jgi:fucose 4-O-acetylase-like acetyltransferase